MPLNTGNTPLPGRELVEQATAAPGELRETKKRFVESDKWFTEELAATLGIDQDLFRRIKSARLSIAPGTLVGVELDIAAQVDDAAS